MRKLLLAPLLALAMLTAGCASLGPAGAILSGSVTNPVTPARALALRGTFKATVLIPASIYIAWPRCGPSAPTLCSKQSVVNQLRVYINPTVVTLRKLTSWAQGNTALDGPALYAAATIAVTSAQSFAVANLPATVFK